MLIMADPRAEIGRALAQLGNSQTAPGKGVHLHTPPPAADGMPGKYMISHARFLWQGANAKSFCIHVAFDNQPRQCYT